MASLTATEAVQAWVVLGVALPEIVVAIQGVVVVAAGEEGKEVRGVATVAAEKELFHPPRGQPSLHHHHHPHPAALVIAPLSQPAAACPVAFVEASSVVAPAPFAGATVVVAPSHGVFLPVAAGGVVARSGLAVVLPVQTGKSQWQR